MSTLRTMNDSWLKRNRIVKGSIERRFLCSAGVGHTNILLLINIKYTRKKKHASDK